MQGLYVVAKNLAPMVKAVGRQEDLKQNSNDLTLLGGIITNTREMPLEMDHKNR